MAMVKSDLYVALRRAGATAQAAEAASACEHRFFNVDARVSSLTWMVGFNLAITGAVLAKLLV